MEKFLDKTGLDTFWAKIKSTFQTLGSLVTAWGSTPSDTKYPSEKLVKDSLNAKVNKSGDKMTGPLQGFLLSARDTTVGNEYNVLLNAKNRGILTFTQSGSGQLTEAQVWGLFDGRIAPQYGPAIDTEDPYILELDLTSYIGSSDHCQVYSAFGWTCRYWEPLRFKVELYNTHQSANEWVTICDYSQTNYTGQYSGGGSANLFVKFGSGTVNPHTGETKGGVFRKIRITIWKGNESTNRWGISEIFFWYPEKSAVYEGLAAFSAKQLNTARKLKTNLARTADSTFDGSADQTNIPVTGTLPVGNGGTGKTSVTAGNYLVGNGTNALTEKTPNTAANELINALSTGEATPTGEDYYVAQFAGGGTTTKTYHRRPVKALWEYIKSQISSVLGLTATSYGGNAATATALASGSADRTKLDGIAAGAEVNVQSDWNQSTTTADDYIKNKPMIPSGSQLVYDCGTGSTSTTDFDNALAAFNAGKWVIINKDSKVYYCVGSYSGPGLRFKQLANEVSLLKVNTLTWTKGSEPTEGTQLEASLSGHTHSQYLTASDITGKMETNGSNATSAAGGNIIRAMGDWTSVNEDNEAVPAANITSGGTTQGRYTFAKIWNWIISHTQTRILKTSSDVYWGVGADSTHTIDLDYDGRTSSPKMGVWVRWGSGSNAKFMAECDASGNCTFNGTSAHARYAYNQYYVGGTGGGTAYWIKIGRVTSSASSGTEGGALTAIISSGFNTAGSDLSAQVIRVSIRSKGQSTNGVTIVGDNVTLGLKSAVDGGDVRFAVHTVTSRTTSVDGIYDIYVEKKAWQYVDVLQLHNDNVSMTYNSDTTKAINDTTDMTIFSPILPYAGSAVSATSATSATELRIPYGSGSAYLQIGVSSSGSGSYLELGTNMADGVMVSYAGQASQAAVAGMLGTTSVGSASNPIYLNNGVPTACNWWVS